MPAEVDRTENLAQTRVSMPISESNYRETTLRVYRACHRRRHLCLILMCASAQVYGVRGQGSLVACAASNVAQAGRRGRGHVEEATALEQVLPTQCLAAMTRQRPPQARISAAKMKVRTQAKRLVLFQGGRQEQACVQADTGAQSPALTDGMRRVW